MVSNTELYLNFLKHAGLYTFINSDNEKKLSNYYLFAFYCVLLSFATVPIIYTFHSMNTEILNLVNVLIYFVPLCQVALKISVFFIYLPSIKSLTVMFNKDYLKCNQTLDANKKVFEKHLFETNQICYIYTFVCYVNVIFWLCMPIIRSAYLHKNHDYVNKVMEFIYPFEYSTSPVYEVILIYEVVVMIVFFMVLVSQDLLFVVFVSVFCGQIETVKSSIASRVQRNLNTVKINKYSTNRVHMKNKLEVIPENSNCTQNNKTFWVNVNETQNFCLQSKCDGNYNDLIEIIKDHQKLMTTSQQLLRVFNPVMNIQLLTSILGVCLITFKMSELNSSEENMKPFLYLRYIHYLTTTLAELLLYCWYGSRLKEQTESVHQSAYECGWYEADKKFQQALLMLSLRSQRPVRLTAWKVFCMDLTAFVMVLRVSYSYYALLRSMSNN